MIRFENISVEFLQKNRLITAVKNVSFEIKQGEIFGIVGTSGAGKSTLLRTINLLQQPTEGKIYIGKRDISNLKGKELRQLRLQIGMIFQQFNLMHSKTVYENIAFALKAAGNKDIDIRRRVLELLILVGLKNKEYSYPSNLSGGEKQRVGIARAIANNPQILLCDEPTSALDSETTNSILSLLKEINKRLGITTVIISHEMDVIKKICDRVAVMSLGKLRELDSVYNLFSSPQDSFTKELINHTIDLNLPERLLKDKREIYKIIYSGDKAEESIISDTIKSFDVNINILHGKIEYISNKALGILLIQIDGKEKDKINAINYITKKTFKTERINE